MSIRKQTRQILNSSRAKSCADLQVKQSQKTNKTIRQQKFIQNLLHKRTHSTKKMFTDQTTYTYKPQISNLAVDLYPSSRSQIQISKQRIFQRLVDNMKSKQQNFKLLKLKKEQDKFKQSCSFIPKISETSKALILAKLKTQGTIQNKQPFTRLYQESKQKKINIQRNYMTAQQRQLTDQHTFQPQINSMSKAILNNESKNMQPIYKRFEQIMQTKRTKNKLIQEYKNRQIDQMTNVKVQNKVSLQLLERNQNYQSDKGNVVKRLLNNYFKVKQQKTNNILAQKQQQLKKQCPFQPTINNNYLFMNASTFDLNQDFLQRQKQFQDAVKQNIEIKANQFVPTFKPQINKLSQLICKQRAYESLEDKLNRLNYEPLFKKQAKIQQLEKSLYKQCKFHPQINQISKALQGPLKQHTCKCHPVPQQFNFMPEINKKSRQMKNNKSVQIYNKKKKQQVVNKIKMQRQYNELIECTFQPKIKNLNKEQLKMNQNTADFVAGVRQFVQKKNMALKRKIQDEKYKQKIFNLQKRYKSKTSTTVQQFKLSHQYYQGKNKKQLIIQAEQKFKKQHPFKLNVQLIR